MRVSVFPAGLDGSGWIRLRWPAMALAAQGADVVVDRVLCGERDALTSELVRAIPDGEDVVVFQRVYTREMLTVIRSFQEQGVAVVIDLDDDLMAIGASHPAFAELRGPAGGDKGWSVLLEACRIADLVTVSTPALAARYASHGRARVVRNGVPRAYLRMERAQGGETPVIGWTGTPTTHPGDLEVVGSAVADICHAGSATFRAIGSQGTLAALGLRRDCCEWTRGHDLANLDYARAYAALDLAIVPLAESAFNRSKSWLKGIEAAALGVPFVASPRSEYTALHALGAGLLADRPREWKRRLLALAQSPDMRLALAAKGRAVAAQHTIEDTVAPQMLEAWTAAREGKLVAV